MLRNNCTSDQVVLEHPNPFKMFAKSVKVREMFALDRKWTFQKKYVVISICGQKWPSTRFKFGPIRCGSLILIKKYQNKGTKFKVLNRKVPKSEFPSCTNFVHFLYRFRTDFELKISDFFWRSINRFIQ